MKLIFIRHGEPDYEHDSLTEKGRREAELVAQKVKEINPDFVYSAPLGRAELTCKYSQEVCGFDYEVLPWLREFPGMAIDKSTGKPMLPWDLKPNFFTTQDELYDSTRWRENEFVKSGDILDRYDDMARGLDKLLEKHGYKKDGRIYKVTNSNHDKIAIFCHFGVESVILSRIFSVSPMIMWHNFVALPTSVTRLVTQEREKGKAIFTCVQYGDLSHLYKGNEEPSFQARWCECYEDDTRH